MNWNAEHYIFPLTSTDVRVAEKVANASHRGMMLHGHTWERLLGKHTRPILKNKEWMELVHVAHEEGVGIWPHAFIGRDMVTKLEYDEHAAFAAERLNMAEARYPGTIVGIFHDGIARVVHALTPDDTPRDALLVKAASLLAAFDERLEFTPEVRGAAIYIPGGWLTRWGYWDWMKKRPWLKEGFQDPFVQLGAVEAHMDWLTEVNPAVKDDDLQWEIGWVRDPMISGLSVAPVLDEAFHLRLLYRSASLGMPWVYQTGDPANLPDILPQIAAATR
jgi:hypothetical protein